MTKQIQNSRVKILAGSLVLLLLAGCSSHAGDPGYPVEAVPFTNVTIDDDFWGPRIRRNHEVTIPIAFGYCESTGRIRNFEIAAGLDTGRFQTIYPFDDSDVFKIMEGAAFSLQTYPDAGLESYLDTLIYKVGLAQESDGYLYTNRTIAEMHGGEGLHSWAEGGRWAKTNILSHELYNIGHMYEAAVAHYLATGKRSFLDIAIKSADLVCNDFGWDDFVSYPGHQVIEMGLVKLYGVTGEKRYLEMAKFFLDARGHRDDGEEYSQSHKKVTEQNEAVGHSVRATYMYSGMADIAAIMNDTAYVGAVDRIWKDIVYRKMYVTGGIGASGGNEGFAEPYHLPNLTAYCETCASIGNIFTNHRLFLMYGSAKYYDVVERTLYNAMLSGVSLTADRFFYPNPLESDGSHERKPWFGCACCPSNVARFLPAIPGYIYAKGKDDLYVNLYASNRAEIAYGKKTVELEQKSNYPWDGEVSLKILKNGKGRFALRLRIPGWATGEALPGNLYRFSDGIADEVVISLNGSPITTDIENGYAVIERNWQEGDMVEIKLPMAVRMVVASDLVTEDSGKIAIQRGPLVFCAEAVDNPDLKVRELTLLPGEGFTTGFVPSLLNGTITIKGVTRQSPDNEPVPVTLIPYHLWNNRGAAEMVVWMKGN